MGVQDRVEPGTHVSVDWRQEEKMGSCLEVGKLEADGLQVQCRKSCPGLQEVWVLAPALPFSNWVSLGQSFQPSGGFLARKIRGLEKGMSLVCPSSLLF